MSQKIVFVEKVLIFKNYEAYKVNMYKWRSLLCGGGGGAGLLFVLS
jgi:hypothetical protein